MTPAMWPLAITPMSTKDSTVTQGTRGIGIQFQLIGILPLISQKKWAPIKTWEKRLPNQEIFFNIFRKPNQKMKFPYSNRLTCARMPDLGQQPYRQNWANLSTTESPEELPYVYEEKLREDPDIYPAFLVVNGPPWELYPAQCPQKQVLSMGQQFSLVPWVYPKNYITLKKYPTDVGMIHLKEK